MKTKVKEIPLTVRLVDTEEVFTLRGIHLSTTVKELKSYLEYAVGIPQFMQRLSYLDEGDLLDSTDIKGNDIVSGAQLRLRIWTIWVEIVKSAALNDSKTLFKLGVTADSTKTTPNSDYLGLKARKAWLAEREFVALFIASHRGHEDIVKQLVAHNANLNGKTSLGRTALHVAAAQDRGVIVDCLLNNGANVNELDVNGESALAVAERFGHKDGARHLFLYQWQVRAMETQQPASVPLLLHQACDSAYPIWLEGTQAQIYFAKVLPPGEFSGTGLEAKTACHSTVLPQKGPEEIDSSSKKRMEFQDWLKKKQRQEQIVADKKKVEEEAKKLEEEKQKIQSVIDKESFETWVKKQQEEKQKGEKKGKGPAMDVSTSKATSKQPKTAVNIETKSDIISVAAEDASEVKALEKFLTSKKDEYSTKPYFKIPLVKETDTKVLDKIRNNRLLRQ